MFFASPFVSAALMMLSSVTALPQPEDGGLAQRVVSAPCNPGAYLYNSNTCALCPQGSYCDGTSAKQCDTGHYQPDQGKASCLATAPGYFTKLKGSTVQSACEPGTYQPFAAQKFCYGAPKGRFQSYYGQPQVCGTCCGWSAPLVNNNIAPQNCTGTATNAYPSSGDGCISSKTGCVHATYCAQTFNTTTGLYDCPAETIRG
ncbi:hypothetical protein DFH09DRAFT_1072138 [Mycena vulgaris]|nr:hypothetical protein DFH09DRAFT_1072138 [Mycena vulgaris]